MTVLRIVLKLKGPGSKAVVTSLVAKDTHEVCSRVQGHFYLAVSNHEKLKNNFFLLTIKRISKDCLYQTNILIK